jgi:hypothetical protein
VHQRRGSDCAIAAAATITGVRYEEAASAAFSLREEGLGGIRPHQMNQLLERLTDVPWRTEWLFRSRVRLRAMKFPHELVLAFISEPWFGRRRHAIVVRDRVIFDGSLEHPISPEDHPCSKWFVSALFVRELT